MTPQHFAYPKSVPPSEGADRAVWPRFRSAVLAGTKPTGTAAPTRTGWPVADPGQ